MSLREGDARDLSSLGLEQGSVRCTITSPPYWELKRYADGDEREIGRGQSKEQYLSAVGDVLAQVHELSSEDGVLWLVADTLRDRSARSAGLAQIMPLPFELAQVAQRVGWRFQDIVIWHKDKTLPYSGQGKLRNLIEYILFFTRSEEFPHRPYRCAKRHMPGSEWLAGWPERYHPLGKRPSNVWRFKLDTQGMWSHAEGRHACPFPQALVAQCIMLTTDKGDIVLDPFAGIGTVVAQAIAMGRRGVGLELNPRNVATFHEHVLPEFQARWEAKAERRRLEREDQRAEAQLIMRLRLLKAGKELLRAVQRLANERPADHPAASVHTVVVLQSDALGVVLDIDQGAVGRAGGQLLLVSDQSDLGTLCEEALGLLGKVPFTSLGLDLDLDVVTHAALSERTDVTLLQEFGISRHGAFTAPVDPQLFDVPPSLLTDIRLETAVSGERESELERARKQGERQLLSAELAAGRPLHVIAQRVGVPQAELHRLLVRHGLLERPKSFSVSLPGQLTI
jgi:DNA modification methylase